MVIRKLNASDHAEVLSMMKVFSASDALLIHPQDACRRKCFGVPAYTRLVKGL